MKKTVSIIGCCVSRNIFYTPQCQAVFEVDNYAFQITPYSMFDEPLNVPYDKLCEVEKRPFARKTLDYNINKNIFQDFENKKSDYIVVDLMACSFILSEVGFNNKKTIVRMGQGVNSLENMKSNKWFADNEFSYKLRRFSEIDSNYVKEGLDKFIEWISSVYRREQVVVCRPYIPYKYIDNNLNVVSYPESKIKCFEEDALNVSELTEYMIRKLTGCLVCDFPRDMIAEAYLFSEGAPYHYSNMDYFNLSNKMLELLNIDIKQYYEYGLSPEAYMMEKWVKKYFDARQMLIDLEEKLLNVKIEDRFVGTSISNIYTRPFDDNLYCVADVYEKVKANECIWRDRYEKLRNDYQVLAEAILCDGNQREEGGLENNTCEMFVDTEYENVHELLKKIKELKKDR